MTISDAVWRIFAAACCVFMISPLLILIMFCFSDKSVISFPIEGLTLDWWETLFSRSEFWKSLRNSAIVTGTVGGVTTLFGTMAAFSFARMRPQVAGISIAILTLPVMLPPLVLALTLLSFFSSLDIRLGLQTVILGHLVFTQPFVILVVHARMARFDYAIVNSARDLGASPFKAFNSVTLPLIRPTIIGAAMIAMALSLDDFIITFFTIGGGNTLPTFLWGMLRKGANPQINIVGFLLMTLTICASLIAFRVTRYRG